MSQDDDQQASIHGELRPMVPRRDLRSVVALVSEGFGEWQSWRGRTFLSLLRVLSYLGPLVTLARVSSAFRQFCSGFVWVEEGQVVGTVAGHPIGPDPRYWIFKNIVVSRSYRGRGIGRQLQRGLIEKALAEEAEKAIVMVRVDNEASLNLTASDGFRQLAATTEMVLTAARRAAPVIEPEDGLRPQKPGDRRQVCDLRRAVTPPALLAFNPMVQDELDPSERPGAGLGRLLDGRWVRRFVAERGSELAAALTVEASLWGEHRFVMTVHPTWRGQIEETLAKRALMILGRFPNRPINARVPATHREAIEVLRRCGFDETKKQVILGIDLERFRG